MVEVDIVDRLTRSLDESIRDSVEGLSAVALAFSGGLDSSVMAFFSSKYSSPRLYVVGEEGSTDLLNAREASQVLDLPLVEIELTQDIVEESLPNVIQVIKTTNPVQVSYKLPEYFVAKVAKERTILFGHGADELFGGYSRYEGTSPEDLTTNMQSDLEKLLRDDLPLDERICRAFGKRFEYPFLSASVVEAAMECPLDLKVSDEGRKIVLRKVAKSVGFPEKMFTRKKKAAQYGTGTIRLIRRIAKKDGSSISRYIEKLADF